MEDLRLGDLVVVTDRVSPHFSEVGRVEDINYGSSGSTPHLGLMSVNSGREFSLPSSSVRSVSSLAAKRQYFPSKHRREAPEPSKWSVGDIVVIGSLRSTDYGRKARIEEFYYTPGVRGKGLPGYSTKVTVLEGPHEGKTRRFISGVLKTSDFVPTKEDVERSKSEVGKFNRYSMEYSRKRYKKKRGDGKVSG